MRVIFFIVLFINGIFGGKIELQLKAVKEPSFRCLSYDFLKYVKEIFNLTTFIETGTAQGWTADQAAKVFEEVYSVELSPDYYNLAQKTNEKNRNVFLFQGNSPKFLLNILQKKKEKVIFWLDAHYSGADTARGEKDSPILDELDAIRKSNIKDSVILIDDLRFFQSYSWQLHKLIPGYPSLKELIFAIKKIDSNYKVFIYGDCALAYTDNIIEPSLALELMTKSRMSEEEPFAYPIDLEKDFKKITFLEKEVILQMTSKLNSVYCSAIPSYNLWTSMILWGDGKSENARNILKSPLFYNYQREKIVYLIYLIK